MPRRTQAHTSQGGGDAPAASEEPEETEGDSAAAGIDVTTRGAVLQRALALLRGEGEDGPERERASERTNLQVSQMHHRQR